MIKRFTILKRNYLSRGKGGWYNSSYECESLVNATDLKIKKTLNENNKNKRTNLWKIEKDYNLTTRIGKAEFLADFKDNLELIRYDETRRKVFKDLAKEVIENL